MTSYEALEFIAWMTFTPIVALIVGCLIMGLFYDGRGGWCWPWQVPND